VTGSSILVDLMIAALVLGTCLVVGARATKPHDRRAVVAAALHPFLSVSLFYSLAIHMHRCLGGWPGTMGEAGFPSDLKIHVELAQLTFGSLLLACIFVWPIVAVLCAWVPRLRPGLRYLGIYALASGMAFGAMHLAPGPFLYWWWD